ncbi:putative protein disulfide-isomerase [Helianthus annuus]|nr:putative protein disulfide-isomerase [Helianthus annuus]
MVEFYATWYGHCQAFKPEYAAATVMKLKVEEAVLGKLDAGEESELAQKYNVEGGFWEIRFLCFCELAKLLLQF